MRKTYRNIGANLDPASAEDKKRIDAWDAWKEQQRSVDVLRWLIDSGRNLEAEREKLKAERERLEQMREDLQKTIREGEHQAEQHALTQIQEDVRRILARLDEAEIYQAAEPQQKRKPQEQAGLVSLEDAARFL